MAKKTSLVGRKSLEPKSISQGSTESRPTSKHPLARRTGEGRGEGRPSSLLDTRVVYCGDNLEQPERMQNEKGRMMKPARFPILHSSFCLLHSPLPASHYVKVMLDQIFGENNFQS
jgi:hypothetical protein